MIHGTIRIFSLSARSTGSVECVASVLSSAENTGGQVVPSDTRKARLSVLGKCDHVALYPGPPFFFRGAGESERLSIIEVMLSVWGRCKSCNGNSYPFSYPISLNCTNRK